MSRGGESSVMTPMDPDTEQALVERLRRGDKAAFDAVYDAFNLRLFTFLLRLTRRYHVTGRFARRDVAAAGEAWPPIAS